MAPQQQQFLHDLQLQQQIQHAMLINPFGDQNYASWGEWSVPAQVCSLPSPSFLLTFPLQQINVHTTGASMPIALNPGLPVAVAAGIFNTEYRLYSNNALFLFYYYYYFLISNKKVCAARIDGVVSNASAPEPTNSRIAICACRCRTSAEFK
jgi:hypothetical protein